MIYKAWSSIEKVSYCLSKSSIKFQGHTGQKIANFDPNRAFLFCNCSLNSPMGLKWCTKIDVVQKRCPIVFRGHPSNLKVTWTEKSMIWNPVLNKITKLVAAIKSLRFALFSSGPLGAESFGFQAPENPMGPLLNFTWLHNGLSKLEILWYISMDRPSKICLGPLKIHMMRVPNRWWQISTESPELLTLNLLALWVLISSSIYHCLTLPNSKVHGANMRPLWGQQDPGEPHVGPMNFAIWDAFRNIMLYGAIRCKLQPPY